MAVMAVVLACLGTTATAGAAANASKAQAAGAQALPQKAILTNPAANKRASATSVSDAIQLLQLGEFGEVEVANDQVGRQAVEAQLKRSTRVKTIVRVVDELGGDGCKRFEMAFIALDIPVQAKAGEEGLWSVVMQWNLCNGGLPPEPR